MKILSIKLVGILLALGLFFSVTQSKADTLLNPFPNLSPNKTPVNLSFSNITNTTFKINWQSGGGTETYYNLYISFDGITYEPMMRGITLSSPYYQVTGSVNTKYWFRVSSGDGVNSDSGYLSGSVTTLANDPGAMIIGEPTTSSIPISFGANGNPISTLYRIDWFDNTNKTAGSLALDGGLGGNSLTMQTKQSWAATGPANHLQSNHSYTFSACAMSYNNNGTYSTGGCPVSETKITLSNPPANFTAIPDPSNNTKINLSWSGDQNNLYLLTDTQGVINTGWLNIVSYSTDAFQCDTTYTFTVKAKNLAGVETTGVSASAKTGACAQAQQAKPIISSFTVTNSTQTGISFAWQGNANNYNLKNETEGTWSGWEGKTSYTDTGLTCGTTYIFSLQGSTNGMYSDLKTLSTSTAACPIVQNTPAPTITSFIVTSLSQNSITLAWQGTALQYQVTEQTSNVSSGWLNTTQITFNNLNCYQTYIFNLRGQTNGQYTDTKTLPVTASACVGAVLPIYYTAPTTTSNNPPALSPCPNLYPGDMVKIVGQPAIYVLNKKLEALFFPSGDVFKSWNADEKYGNYKSITAKCFDSIPVPTVFPAAVNFRPGSYVVRKENSSDKQLYVILPNNTLSPISLTAAQSLYGKNFKTVVIPDVIWPQYVNRGAAITSAIPHPGMLVKNNNSIYYVNSANVLNEISTDGFSANRLRAEFVRSVSGSALTGFVKGLSIDEEIDELSNRINS